MQAQDGPNWNRIIGNAGITFFTVLSTTSLIGLDAETAFKVALFPALIQAGLTFCKDLVKESDNSSKGYAFLNAVTVL